MGHLYIVFGISKGARLTPRGCVFVRGTADFDSFLILRGHKHMQVTAVDNGIAVTDLRRLRLLQIIVRLRIGYIHRHSMTLPRSPLVTVPQIIRAGIVRIRPYLHFRLNIQMQEAIDTVGSAYHRTDSVLVIRFLRQTTEVGMLRPIVGSTMTDASRVVTILNHNQPHNAVTIMLIGFPNDTFGRHFVAGINCDSVPNQREVIHRLGLNNIVRIIDGEIVQDIDGVALIGRILL